MAHLSFEVDTSPIAQTMDSIKAHVIGVTAAVTAMEAAVIASERQASKLISENVDNGFFQLVKSQISQKSVAAYSEMTSKEAILFQLAKALERVKVQMEADYNMIRKRYNKLFLSLNRMLETRVKELDRPAMRMAEIKKSIVFDKLKDDSALLLSAADETISMAQTAANGKLKQKTFSAMKTLYDYSTERESYNTKLDNILQNKPLSEGKDGDFCFIPVIFNSVESFLSENALTEAVYLPRSDAWQNTTPVIAKITQVKDDLSWKETSAEEKELIKKEYYILCEKEGNDKRIQAEMVRLFENSSWEAL